MNAESWQFGELTKRCQESVGTAVREFQITAIHRHPRILVVARELYQKAQKFVEYRKRFRCRDPSDDGRDIGKLRGSREFAFFQNAI
ncbi:MAG: hypothetical protein O3A00_16230 [Planctomycetota bacterium]|nr:hypothetical protein [Planctomycetota bacterium]